MNYYDAVRLLAMKAVMKPNQDDSLRSIFRWYSRTFHTPLHVVPDLPLENVLQAYYEETFEGLEESQRKDILEDLLLTDEQRKEKDFQKDIDDFEMTVMAKIKEQEYKSKQQNKLDDIKPVIAPHMHTSVPEAKLPEVWPVKTSLPEGIKVTFVDKELFEDEIEALDRLKTEEGER